MEKLDTYGCKECMAVTVHRTDIKNYLKKNSWGTKNSVDPFEMFVGVKHEKLMVEGCIFIQIFLFRAVVNMYVNSE